MKTRLIKYPARGSYLEMIGMFPLRPRRCDAECEQASRILERWFGRADLETGQEDYVKALAVLVADYEDKSHPVDISSLTPLDSLRHLIEEREMTAADLGRVLGNSGLASQILLGRRQFSKASIHKLAQYFHVDAGTFL